MGPVDRLFDGSREIGRTDALVVVHRGEVAIERYGAGVTAASTLRSWSMAKSMLHAVVGMLVADGRLDLEARAPVDAWADPADPRHAITLGHLMTMRAGLEWVEAPTPDAPGLPDSVRLVYGHDGGPMPDTAAWAAARRSVEPPGSRLVYSSGTSAIVSGVVRDLVGPGPAYAEFLRRRLFDPVGMHSATPKFDRSGSWLASSVCFATARDFARFGQLYLDGGVAGDQRLLTEDWVATAATETGRDDQGRIHTMHWWRFGDDPWGAYVASGYLGQYIVVVPALQTVVVRLGETPTDERDHVHDALTEVLARFER